MRHASLRQVAFLNCCGPSDKEGEPIFTAIHVENDSGMCRTISTEWSKYPGIARLIYSTFDFKKRKSVMNISRMQS